MVEKNEFSKDWLRDLKNQLLEIKLKGPQPCFAAFDADGTLWNTDVGENFFQFQIDNCNLAALKDLDPWSYYKELKANDPRSAYIWLAKINSGHPLSEVRGWAKEACNLNPPKVFKSQRNLILWLEENDIIPVVVTASIKWAVEPAAALLGIPQERVIGVQTKIDLDNNVTTQQEGPITWRDGKVTGSQILTGGKKPILCVGNTLGDKDLLGSSAGLSLAIQTQLEDNSLFRDEQGLFHLAKENSWLTHSFY